MQMKEICWLQACVVIINMWVNAQYSGSRTTKNTLFINSYNILLIDPNGHGR
jgi:hypothetical protein